MLTAQLARINSAAIADKLKYTALVTIANNPCYLWDWIEGKIRADDNTLEVPVILEKLRGENYWTQDKVYKALQDLGFEVEPSCSSNPDNERWFLKW